MKYVINEKVLERKGVSMPTMLALLLIKNNVNIATLMPEMEKAGMIEKCLDGMYSLTEKYDTLCEDIMVDTNTKLPDNSKIEELAAILMSYYPTGKKDGTQIYWRGNKKDTVNRLKKFLTRYGTKYNKQIMKATKAYVDSFNGNYTRMRVLKYFIWKDERRVNEEGIGYVESISDLASYIENEGQEEAKNNDNWTSNIN